MKIVGITGGIASGKSHVANYIKTYTEHTVIDIDKVAKDISSQSHVSELIKHTFPSVVQGNKVSRELLGNLIFQDETARLQLNEIMFPLIAKEVKLLVSERKSKGDKLLFIDSPLLIESGQYHEVNEIIVVDCNYQERINRIVKRNGWSLEKAVDAINSQMSSNEQISYSKYLIDTSEVKSENKNEVPSLEFIIESIVDSIESNLDSFDTDSKCVYAGTFDPFTLGHLAVLKHASQIFNYTYLIIAENSTKKRITAKDETLISLKKILINNGIDNVILVDGKKRIVGDIAREVGAKYAVRGTRDISDDIYESKLRKIQNEFINPNLQTIMIPAMEYENVSSSMVKELVKLGRLSDAKKLLPDEMKWTINVLYNSVKREEN